MGRLAEAHYFGAAIAFPQLLVPNAIRNDQAFLACAITSLSDRILSIFIATEAAHAVRNDRCGATQWRPSMSGMQIRFEDGAAYDRGMGQWSRVAGNVFLDWVAPEPGLRWVDVGCGSGAFSELMTQRCAPAEIQG